MERVYCLIHDAYRSRNSSCRFTTITLPMFCDVSTPTSHKNKFPKLKGRAGEIRDLMPCLLDVWEQVVDLNITQHVQVKTLLQCSCHMEWIMDSHSTEDAWSKGVSTDFKQCGFAYNELMNSLCKFYGRRGLTSMKLFNIVPKNHYLAHICLMCAYMNPRLAWCYMGEDFMQKIRRLAGGCCRGNNAVNAGRKLMSNYRSGIAFELQKFE